MLPSAEMLCLLEILAGLSIYLCFCFLFLFVVVVVFFFGGKAKSTYYKKNGKPLFHVL